WHEGGITVEHGGVVGAGQVDGVAGGFQCLLGEQRGGQRIEVLDAESTAGAVVVARVDHDYRRRPAGRRGRHRVVVRVAPVEVVPADVAGLDLPACRVIRRVGQAAALEALDQNFGV